MPGIHSERVILLEGNAEEIVPNAKLAAHMYGFVIMVPPGEEAERLLDMLWRITIAYAGRPSLLRSRATVRKMVEAVWSKESRKPSPVRRPARKSGPTDRAQRGDVPSSKFVLGPAPDPDAKSPSATKSLPSFRDKNKAKTRK
jgi:hypothetical protein